MAQYKSTRVSGDRAGYMQGFGNALVLRDAATPSAALALNDTIDLLRIPSGTRLFELWKFNGDFDTGTTLQYKLGYRRAQADGVITEDDDYFVAAGATDLQAAVAQSAPTRFVFSEITFDEDVFVTLTVTAAATGVSGTPTLTITGLGEARGTR